MKDQEPISVILRRQARRCAAWAAVSKDWDRRNYFLHNRAVWTRAARHEEEEGDHDLHHPSRS